jgi:hypothetical protein
VDPAVSYEITLSRRLALLLNQVVDGLRARILDCWCCKPQPRRGPQCRILTPTIELPPLVRPSLGRLALDNLPRSISDFTERRIQDAARDGPVYAEPSQQPSVARVKECRSPAAPNSLIFTGELH